MVTLLLGRCNPWMMNHQHETALAVAQQKGNSKIIRLLDVGSTTKNTTEESKTRGGSYSESETEVPLEGSNPGAPPDESVISQVCSSWKVVEY